MRRLFILLVSAALGLGVGCQKKPVQPARNETPEVLFRYHFVGAQKLAADTNAAKLKTIWALPGTTALRDKTLQKLAAAMPELSKLASAGTSAENAAFVRPLMDDLLATESTLVVHGVTNQPAEWTLAVRLDETRTTLWQTNLWQLLLAWKLGAPAVTNVGGQTRWEIKEFMPLNRLRLAAVGEWLVLSAGEDRSLEHDATIARIKTSGRPVPAAENYWLSTEFNGPRCAKVLGLANWLQGPPGQWPRVQLTLNSQSDKVRTKARLLYAERLPFSVEAWQMPVETIRFPLTSFTAAQGLTGWLNRLADLQKLDVQSWPNQLFLWAQDDSPMQTFAAMPTPDATNMITRIAAKLPPFLESYDESRNAGELLWISNRAEVIWRIAPPVIVPSLRPVIEVTGQFVVGGLFVPSPSTNPPPPELLAQFIGRTNLIYYDWEITQYRLNQWFPLAQLPGLIDFERAMSAKLHPKIRDLTIPGQAWLTTVSTNLGNTVTEITVVSPQELNLTRTAHLGLTGFELVMLMRWLENPAFPSFQWPVTASANPAPAKLSRQP